MAISEPVHPAQLGLSGVHCLCAPLKAGTHGDLVTEPTQTARWLGSVDAGGPSPAPCSQGLAAQLAQLAHLRLPHLTPGSLGNAWL